MPASLFDHVQPHDFARQALSMDLAKFATHHGGAQFLVVHLPDVNGPLATGLNSTVSDERVAIQPAVHLLGYNTVLHPGGPIGSAPSGGPDQAQGTLLRRVRRSLQFIVPLRKRATVKSAFQSRISVGRATNQDILLRDASVSKSHAWFEVDEMGTFHVADSGSTNGTKIETRKLEPRAPQPVSVGEIITFGSIETLLIDAESLWRTFDSARHELRPPTR